MNCPHCSQPALRFGKNRNGSQRFVCRPCRKTFSEAGQDRRCTVDPAQIVFALKMLLEGMSIRSAERLLGIGRDAIIEAMFKAGERCQLFLEAKINGIPVNDVECDELWSFIGCKEKTRKRLNKPATLGDCYTFTGMERTTKLILAWHVGKRCFGDTLLFAGKLKKAVSGRFQLSTDGYVPYVNAMIGTFGNDIDFATIIKLLGESEELGRYSPPVVWKIIEEVRAGQPDQEMICTSHVERHNRSIRMGNRRFTRLTDAHSKKPENHEAMVALFLANYNFCRPHMTLSQAAGCKTTPAMAAGLTDHVWSLEELLANAA